MWKRHPSTFGMVSSSSSASVVSSTNSIHKPSMEGTSSSGASVCTSTTCSCSSASGMNNHNNNSSSSSFLASSFNISSLLRATSSLSLAEDDQSLSLADLGTSATTTAQSVGSFSRSRTSLVPMVDPQQLKTLQEQHDRNQKRLYKKKKNKKTKKAVEQKTLRRSRVVKNSSKQHQQHEEVERLTRLVHQLVGLLSQQVEASPGTSTDRQETRAKEPALQEEQVEADPADAACASTSTETEACSSTSIGGTATTTTVAAEPLTTTTEDDSNPKRPTTTASGSGRVRHVRMQVNGLWGSYSGPCLNSSSGLVQGCVVRFDNGDLYLGSLLDGEMTGRGSYYYKDGRIDRGIFAHNKLSC